MRLGGQRPKGGPILAFSDTFFGAEGAEKWELLDFLGKIGISDTFLSPQAPKILRNFGILVKNRPIL